MIDYESKKWTDREKWNAVKFKVKIVSSKMIETWWTEFCEIRFQIPKSYNEAIEESWSKMQG